jgi:sterol 14-demethylase
MDETVYKNPGRWDPARYLSERGEDKKKQHGYVGWGSGLHPCREKAPTSTLDDHYVLT